MLTNNNLHIVRIGYKNENKRETSDTYILWQCPCPVESDGRVDCLYTLRSFLTRSSREGLLP